ncbi:MAG: hypothetical protein O0X49_08480, partial [Methanocorpusculum sp.]|nr:hypothetical protein [Methanocorpusculum sp.]
IPYPTPASRAFLAAFAIATSNRPAPGGRERHEKCDERSKRRVATHLRYLRFLFSGIPLTTHPSTASRKNTC